MPPQQQRLPIYFKAKPRTGTIGTSGNAPASFAVKPKQQRRRTINPYHMEQIVNTTDSDALRGVLLNLCKISPALSEAIARGLAPHSTYAQALVTACSATDQSRGHRRRRLLCAHEAAAFAEEGATGITVAIQLPYTHE
jgi:hypothetical protein